MFHQLSCKSGTPIIQQCPTSKLHESMIVHKTRSFFCTRRFCSQENAIKSVGSEVGGGVGSGPDAAAVQAAASAKPDPLLLLVDG